MGTYGISYKGTKIDEGQIAKYYDFVFNDNNYDITFEEKLTAIYNFAEEAIESESIIFSSMHPLDLKNMIKDWKCYKKAQKPGWFDQAKAGNPSVSRQTRQSTGPKTSETPNGLSIQNNKSGKYAGIWAVKGNRTIDVSNPYLGYVEDLLIPPFYDITGVGLWRPMKRTKDKMDRAGLAMHRLDMPLIGGFSGGMGSYLLTMKWIGGNVTRESLTLSFFAAYSVMISKGYHSFHEVASIAGTLNLWYYHGNYLSLIQEGPLGELDDVKELITRFGELLHRASRTGKKYVASFDTYKLFPDNLSRKKDPIRRRRSNSII